MRRPLLAQGRQACCCWAVEQKQTQAFPLPAPLPQHPALGPPPPCSCGFSRKVVEALRTAGCTDFGSFDILADEAVRQGLKEYSSWPTYPQLYVNGELLGGCDIVLEMAKAGELKDAIEEMKARN